MKVISKSGKLILVPETAEESEQLADWKEQHSGHVFHLHSTSGSGLALFDLGPKADACNEPIQVSSMVKDPPIQLISNFAHAPFELDGRSWSSVEGFWQGLKFEKAADRRRLAELSGKQAREAGEAQGYGPTVTYEGESIPVGTWRHWALMERACWAKFSQNEDAQMALLSTGNRPLVHRMRRDSKTIPGVIMAEIRMRVRARLGKQTDLGVEEE